MPSRNFSQVLERVGYKDLIHLDDETNVLESPTAEALVDANPDLSTPGGTSIPTGAMMDYWATTAPDGWVPAIGRTIGDATSGGVERANADTEALFTLLWNNTENSTLAVEPGGKGVSAAADFAAHKTITLPDCGGRVVAGNDEASSRLTSVIADSGIGSSGGDAEIILDGTTLAAHDHAISPVTGSAENGAIDPITVVTGINTDVGTNTTITGDSGAHDNVQPTIIAGHKIIKL